MTNNQLTRERLAKIKSWRETYGAGSNVMLPAEEAEELARIALAAMDSEPVAWTDEEELRDVERSGCGYLFTVKPVTPHADERRIILLYRHAQQPVVPDEITSASAPEVFEVAAEAERLGLRGTYASYAVGWNACRAAMLQTEPVSGAYKLPDGYCIMPVALTAKNGAKYALSGEFSIPRVVICPECDGDGCSDCDGRGDWHADQTIDWSTIKLIYQKAVEVCALPAAPQQEKK